LPRALAKLDRYGLLTLDVLSYVRKDQAETSVMFELIAERYERRSILITANQSFSGYLVVLDTQVALMKALGSGWVAASPPR
jgi:DNA replication protein DnaC